MAKATGRKLKVFGTRIGFYDVVVAVPSRAAALRAFGTKQDLFAQGMADEVTDAAVVAAALAEPETPLRRPAGSSGSFAVDPARPRISDMGEAGGAPQSAKPARAQRSPPKADRSRLTAAETELAAIDGEHEAEKANLRREIQSLEAEEERLRGRIKALAAETEAKERVWRQRREKAGLAVERERRAYHRDGGKD